ncbi:GIY-YIG nuclease family protein [Bacillus sp. AFS031507]|uniref:GIY-YIG nuclease family protein n=1 Tax=Bacillus sp. AFS031507 TaxID=2033496 RepID=UPI000BFD96F1|nr:GIY-YIG nuclease family protein [Bacillus sp. AFS031507]PGY11116.1 hypothetical protein COE25_11380 [Bacillus sp. AFS031507]
MEIIINESNRETWKGTLKTDILEIGDKLIKKKGIHNSIIYSLIKEDVISFFQVINNHVRSFQVNYKLFREYSLWHLSEAFVAKSTRLRKKMFESDDYVTAIPHKTGVYVIYDKNDTIVYVGHAHDLKDRLDKYAHTYTDYCYRIQVYFYENDYESEHIAETCFINALFPYFNVQKVYYDKSSLTKIPMKFTTLSSLEEDAKELRVTPWDLLLHDRWRMINEDDSYDGVYIVSWIRDKKDDWIKEIAEKFDTTSENILLHARTFVRNVNKIEDEENHINDDWYDENPLAAYNIQEKFWD